AGLAALLCLLFGNACEQGSTKELSATTHPVKDPGTTADPVPDTLRLQRGFGESVNRALSWDAARTPREAGNAGLRMDGLWVLYIEHAAVPFNLRTTLMDVDILEVPLLLRGDAFNKEAGQSLEVFSGALKVEKNYSSDFPSLDTLRAGDLYMISK